MCAGIWVVVARRRSESLAIVWPTLGSTFAQMFLEHFSMELYIWAKCQKAAAAAGGRMKAYPKDLDHF